MKTWSATADHPAERLYFRWIVAEVGLICSGSINVWQ
jgi:hypothetical protein